MHIKQVYQTPSPEDLYKKQWQVFWLVLLLPAAFPTDCQWQRVRQGIIRTYSYGYSSGLSPDSLLLTVLRKQNRYTIIASAKIMD
jgi:hypothetical protein